MKIICCIFLVCLVAGLCSSEACDFSGVNFDTGGLSRAALPEGFIFGTATSAYQVEGMADKDGRGQSIWDPFVKLPDGTGEVNWKGVAYYNRLIDYLIQRGIIPYANLHHSDLPLALQERYGGLLDKQIVFLHPFTYGEYPRTMQEIVKDRLPKFTNEEIALVKGSIDFVGINQYTTSYMCKPRRPKPTIPSYQSDWNVGFAYEKNGKPIGPRAHSGWLYQVPWGMYKALMYVKERYDNPNVIVTENGKKYYYSRFKI